MAQISFRFWLYLFTDFLYIVPIMYAFPKMKILSKGQKWFVYYLLGYFTLNVIQNTLFLGFSSRNLFLYYFYSLIDCLFIGKVFQYFFQNQVKYKCIFAIFGIGFLSLLIDLIWITGLRNEENLFSNTIINICIFVASTYYLVKLLLNKILDNLFNELNLYIALCLMIRSFLKSIFSFLRNYLLETQSNYYVTAQIDNFFNFFNICTLIIVSWAFYNLKTNRTLNVDEQVSNSIFHSS